jgi:hypothetical protein
MYNNIVFSLEKTEYWRIMNVYNINPNSIYEATKDYQASNQ